MTQAELRRFVAGLDNESLAELDQAAKATIEERRRKYSIADIRPGMDKETEVGVLAEIQRALKDV
ncbi:MAG: hypothetical protein ACKV22_09785 [Bryobacteraceae bacterium]